MTIAAQISRRLLRRFKAKQRESVVTFLHANRMGTVYDVDGRKVTVSRDGIMLSGSESDRAAVAAHVAQQQAQGDAFRARYGYPVQAPPYPLGILRGQR